MYITVRLAYYDDTEYRDYVVTMLILRNNLDISALDF